MKRNFLFDYLICSLSSDISESRLKSPVFAMQNNPAEIWTQKIFCLLSSQFNAVRAANIAHCLVEAVPFFDQSLTLGSIEEACFTFLSSSKAGYRFPKSRALQISQCWFPFAQIKDQYHDYVSSFGSERCARNQIVERFPGLGLKQGSMFLRNIGAAKTLSVVDTHILFYLDVCHGWRADRLTPAKYLEAEDILTEAAARHSLDLNVFDTVVWTAARAIKRVPTYV
jgi:N-glycosylase/DNA lyase